LLNSLAGLASTFANIYGVQHGDFSTATITTLIVIGATGGVCLILTFIYGFVLLGSVKKKHDREVGTQRAGKRGEGVVDESTRRSNIWKNHGGGGKQMETQYVNMLLALDGIPRTHNILVAIACWIVLAGFLILPGTFTSLSQQQQQGFAGAALDVINHLPL
jgi:UPF0716 family protein affecting phage T7 exclusion